MKSFNELSKIDRDLPQDSHAGGLSFEAYPIESWLPEHCGEMDLMIKADGQWWHEGNIISREKLVLLFSKILCKENEQYYLKTPIEKIEIIVEDAPFVVVDYQISTDENGVESIILKTNIGDDIPLSTDYPLQLRGDDNTPYLILKRGLDALINRAVFYDLVEIALRQTNDLKSNETKSNNSNVPDFENELWLTSNGSIHLLGQLNEDS